MLGYAGVSVCRKELSWSGLLFSPAPGGWGRGRMLGARVLGCEVPGGRVPE